MNFLKRILALFFVIVVPVLFFRNDNETVADGFVYVEKDGFKVSGAEFFPIMLNYVVDFQNDESHFIVAPSVNYDSCGHVDAIGFEAAQEQMRAHFALISRLGFNTVRICLDRVGCDRKGRFYYQAGRRFYLDDNRDVRAILRGIAAVADIADEYNLRLMILIKSPIDKDSELQSFTEALLFNFRNNPTIFAYDFMNEPLYFDAENFRFKSSAFKIVKRWYKMMRKYAPHQLFTIGFAEPIEVFEWDCSMLPVDFVEIHTYNPLRIPSEIYWYSKYCGKPWMIGETGLPVDNVKVPYDEQVILIRDAYKIARDGGCCGFGLWQFFDDLSLSFEGSFTGLLAHGGRTEVADGYTVKGTLKPAAAVIATLQENYSPKKAYRPVNYYNMLGYNNICIKGRVVDYETGEAIEGAVVRGWNISWRIGMNTYSDENGCFTLYSNDSCPHFEISAPCYSNSKFDTTPIYTPLSENSVDFDNLSGKDVEYHGIDYHHFLKNGSAVGGNFNIFDFDSSLFHNAQWGADLGTIRLLHYCK